MAEIFIGFFLATIGASILNSLCDIISILTEWLKAAVGVKIVACNAKIVNEKDNVSTQVIGFTLPDEVEEEIYE